MMTTLDRQHHLLAQVPDYVLGLLGEEDARRLERHAAACPVCREAIDRERSFYASVRTTVRQATQPSRARLAALRPAPPAAPVRAFPSGWQRLAPVTMLLLLILSVVFVQPGNGGQPLNDSLRSLLPATHTPTATATSLPTATIAAQPPVERPARTFAPAIETIKPAPTPSVVLMPTPVAMLPAIAPITN